MTEEKKKETDKKKLEGGKEGRQSVQDTGRAKGARQKANKEEKHEMAARMTEEEEFGRTEG